MDEGGEGISQKCRNQDQRTQKIGNGKEKTEICTGKGFKKSRESIQNEWTNKV